MDRFKKVGRQVCSDCGPRVARWFVCFQTENTNLGKFWRALDWKMLIYFMPIWNILQIFGIFYRYLGYFTVIRGILQITIWYILCSFGTFFRFSEKTLATLQGPVTLLSDQKIGSNGRWKKIKILIKF
jgi:hypothetical protein